MFTNSDKAFINFNYFYNERVLVFKTLNCQQARKKIQTDHKFTLTRRGNEPQSKQYCISFRTEDRTGRWQSKRINLFSETAADATLSPSFEPSE